MWNTLPIERFIESKLKERHAEQGETQWGRYIELRTELSEQLLPWILRNEPNLSDHGIDHIHDVMTKVTMLLGLPEGHGDEESWTLPTGYTPYEMLLLLLGCLTHDVGNILGRDKHNLAIGQAAVLAGTAWDRYPIGDRRIIERIGRSHSGKSPDGSRDTLAELATQRAFFAQAPVRLVEIAAVLRFADELAEGPQRTSTALLALAGRDDAPPGLKLTEGSRLYHLYSAITTYHIDYSGGRILIDYDVDRARSDYPVDADARRALILSLLTMAYARALKVNAERQYARHYAQALAHFRETSINLRFSDRGCPLENLDRTVIISDARTAFETEHKLEKLNPLFALDTVMDTLMGTEE